MTDPDRRRKRKAQSRRSHEGRREQDEAAVARSLNRQFRRAFMRRWAARLILLLAAIIAIQHWVAHLGGWDTGWQDLAVGYPMAGVVALVGLIMLGNAPSPR